MATAKHDENRNPTLIGVSSVDLETPINVAVNPVTGYIKVDSSVSDIAAINGLKDNAVVGADNQGFMALGTDGANYQVLSTDATGHLQVDILTINGAGAPTIDSYTHLAINLAAGANQVLVSSAANKQIWVYGVGFTTSVAGTVSFQDEDDTAITGIMPFATNSGMVINPSGNFAMPIWKLATDHDLEIDLVTCDIDGWLDYAIISV